VPSTLTSISSEPLLDELPPELELAPPEEEVELAPADELLELAAPELAPDGAPELEELELEVAAVAPEEELALLALVPDDVLALVELVAAEVLALVELVPELVELEKEEAVAVLELAPEDVAEFDVGPELAVEDPVEPVLLEAELPVEVALLPVAVLTAELLEVDPVEGVAFVVAVCSEDPVAVAVEERLPLGFEPEHPIAQPKARPSPTRRMSMFPPANNVHQQTVIGRAGPFDKPERDRSASPAVAQLRGVFLRFPCFLPLRIACGLAGLLPTLLVLPAHGQGPASGRVGVEVAAGQTCPDAEQLRRALHEALPEWELVAGAPDGLGPLLRVGPGARDQVSLLLLAPGAGVEQRVLAVDPAACRDSAQTIALIAKVWLRRLPPTPSPPLPAAASPEHPRPRERAAPRSAKGVPEEPPATNVLAALEADAGPPPEEVEPPPAVDAGPPRLETSTEGVAPAGPEAEPAGPGPRSVHLDVGLGGAGTLGLAASAVTAGGLLAVVDVAYQDRFGLAGRAALDSTMEDQLPSTSVTVVRRSFGLGGWWTVVRPSEDATLRLGATALLARLEAISNGPGARNAVRVMAEPGAALGATFDQPLGAGLRFWAEPAAWVWFHQDRFFYNPSFPETQVTIPAFWLGFYAGLSWRFF
jgi:hypothetical protein